MGEKIICMLRANCVEPYRENLLGDFLEANPLCEY